MFGLRGSGRVLGRVLGLALVLVFSGSVWGQLPLDAPLETGTRYSAGVPTPESVLGFRVGARHSRSHEVVEYFEAVARASGRVRLVDYGRSWGGRRLVYAVVSDPANLARLGEIQAANRRNVFAADFVTDEELAGQPLVVWMGYGVHGNEASVTDAAMLVLYHLAAGGREVGEMLKEMVVVVAPNYNPDGRDRFVDWVNGFRGQVATTDGQDWEHNAGWPGGRVNHYWFDLNRDWFALTQPESYLRQAEYVKWRPQVTLDYHEMGAAGYFFQPGEPLRVHPLTPRANQDWTRVFAGYHAKALEAVGERYFVEERFDDFYLGKGSTYPDLVGSVGILFEQGSSRGLRSVVGGEELSYARTVRNQVATSLSSLAASRANRAGLLRFQRDFFRERVSSPEGAAYVIEKDDAGAELVGVLLGHEIDVRESGGRWVVPVGQPLGRLVRGLFEGMTVFSDTGFYDVSSWSLRWGSEARVRVLGYSELAALGEGRRVSAGDLEKRGRLSLAERPVGWLIGSGRGDFHRAVYEAQRSGRRAFFLRRDIGGGKAGDVFVLAGEGDVAFFGEMARRLRVEVRGVAGQTGDVVSWGGSGVSALALPRVAILAGPGVDTNNAGEVWWALDAQMGMEVSVVNPATVGDLSRYSVIVLAGGSYPVALAGRLADWVQGGGVLVGTSTGANWVASTDIWRLETARFTPDVTGLAYGEVGAAREKHGLPGGVFRVEYDRTHPLTFGVGTEVAFREGGVFLVGPREAGVVVGRYAESPLVSGYATPEVLDVARGKAAVLARRSGSGSVVLLADNPVFRGFFTAQRRLFLNAVFFGRSF